MLVTHLCSQTKLESLAQPPYLSTLPDYCNPEPLTDTKQHSAAPAPSRAEGSSRQANRNDGGSNSSGSGTPATLESAAFHLIAAGAGCIALTVMRLFKRQSRSLKDACGAKAACPFLGYCLVWGLETILAARLLINVLP